MRFLRPRLLLPLLCCLSLRADPGRIQLLMDFGDYPQASELLTAYAQETGTNATCSAFLGLLHTKCTRYAEAEAAFQRAINLEPHQPLHRWNLAEFYYLTGEWEKAATLYDSLPDSLPQKHLAVYKAILTQLHLRRTENAWSRISKLRMSDENPLFLHAHAAWHFYHGRPAEGKWFAESARSIYQPGGVQLYRQPLVDLGWL